jgi:hypothetical protein
MIKIIVLLISIMVYFSAVAFADCIYNGVYYPPGTVINGLTCQANGNWE